MNPPRSRSRRIARLVLRKQWRARGATEVVPISARAVRFLVVHYSAVNADEQGVAVLSQVDGARWLSLEGKASVNTDPDAVRDAELRYAQRYRTPRVNPRRVVIEVRVERVLGSSDLLDRAAE